ncbi:hypothetical protein GCM10020254_17200 [Streptomyces goshikiensis]
MRADVDKKLAQLDTQIADAYQKLSTGQARGDALLGQLKQQRGQTINQLANSIGQSAERPKGMESLVACTMKQAAAADPADAGAAQNAAAKGAAAQGRPPGQGRPGPQRLRLHFLHTSQCEDARQPERRVHRFPLRAVRPQREQPLQPGQRHRGPPGVSNGAHHMHDYVGNKITDAFSTNNSLAAAGTTCTNGDQSAYYWPVLRLRDGRAEKDANAPGGGQDANVGTILKPKQVTTDFKGSPNGKVTAMPRFMRIITGDAKAFTNGPGNANASWSCTGFENRQLKDKYPVCPKGSDVVRTFKFQSCWDGKNIDSANHRTHVAFANANGSCPNGFKAIPQLVQRIVYAVPAGSQFAVDSFPEQLHKPVTDHGDFINVMKDGLMANAVRCINDGRACR